MRGWRPGRGVAWKSLFLGLLGLPAASQGPDPQVLVERLYGKEPGEWAKGLFVQLRIDDYPAHLYLAASGEARLQTELPEGRVWDILGPDGAWRCQPREIWPLQGGPLARLRLLGKSLGLLALWPLQAATQAPGPEGELILKGGARLRLDLDSDQHPQRFTLVEPDGQTLLVEAIGPRLKRTQSSPAWPQHLEASWAGREPPLRVRLDSLRPFTFLDPGFFRPRRGVHVHGKLLPESHPLGRLLLKAEAPEQAVVLPASRSSLEQQNVLLLIGEALVAAGFTLSRLPAYVHEADGWRVLVPFTGQGPTPRGLKTRELRGGTYARLYLEGAWDESALRGVHRLEQLLNLQGLAPTGPVQIVPFRRPGFLLMPFEQEERITEIRVRVKGP